MFFVAILYLFVGIGYLIYEFNYISRIKKLEIISLFRLMYSVIYGFLPAIMLYRIGTGNGGTLYMEESEYAVNMLIALVISVVEYVVLTLFYYGTKKSRANQKTYPELSLTTQKVSLTAVCLIGFLSLILWTRAFGSIMNFIINADAIRANYSNVYNPFAFMEHFTKVFLFAFFVVMALLIREKRQGKIRIYTVLLMIATLAGAITVMLCTDSRGTIGTLIIVTVLYILNEKMENMNFPVGKAIKILVIFVAVGFVAIVSSEGIMSAFRGSGAAESSASGSKGLIDTFIVEFGYTFHSQAMAIKTVMENPFQTMFLNDIVGGITAWVPSRFIPFELPLDIWDYNSQLLSNVSFFYGQAPTDFVTTTLYWFGPMGIFAGPALMGWLLKKIETGLRRATYSPYLMAVYARFMYYSIWWVSHCSIQYTMLGVFGMFLVHMTMVVSRSVFKDSRKIRGDNGVWA